MEPQTFDFPLSGLALLSLMKLDENPRSLQVVLFHDGLDVLYASGAKDILRSFSLTNSTMMFGAECGCHPQGSPDRGDAGQKWCKPAFILCPCILYKLHEVVF